MYINNRGYIILDIYDNGKTIRIKEHRLTALINNSLADVLENIIHHKNGLKLDNRIENLDLMSHSEHISLHNKGKKSNNFNPCIIIRKNKDKACKQGFIWRAQPIGKDGRIGLQRVNLEECKQLVQNFINSEENTLGYTSYQVKEEEEVE